MQALCTTLLLLISGVVVSSGTKRWRRDTNWSTGSNWSGGRPPCALQRAVFPPHLPLAVSLPKYVAVREMVLPRSGELLLPNDGQIVVGRAPLSDDPTCQPIDVMFSRTEMAAWLDPTNWLADGATGQPPEPNPVPHGERVPCMFERAVFPSDSTFYVQLPEAPIGVGSIVIGDQELDQTSWSELLSSESGRRQFVSRESWDFGQAVAVLGQTECPYPEGCPCISQDTALPHICRHVAPSCAQQLPCYTPVTPLGHCCPVCGAVVLVPFSAGFALERLRTTVLGMVDESSGVVWHVSTPNLNSVAQIVLLDKDQYTGRSFAVANLLSSAILQDLSLMASGVSVRTAGAPMLDGAGSVITGFVFGSLAVVLFVMAALFVVFVYSQGGSLAGEGRPFVFARFDNVPEGETVAVEPVLPEKAFDNPMYGRPGVATPALGTERRKASHENPTFTELQKRVEVEELVEVDMADSSDV